ncbi:stress-inducible protein [Actinidia rufa]|uniref:Stress-inducible protein n=1 Tax=Actinidia rufa TaxID=165716 RepID=A0A7J0D810_9ERIC|nr:stress-inducible protein [Actinidia rufa]
MSLSPTQSPSCNAESLPQNLLLISAFPFSFPYALFLSVSSLSLLLRPPILGSGSSSVVSASGSPRVGSLEPGPHLRPASVAEGRGASPERRTRRGEAGLEGLVVGRFRSQFLRDG